MKAGLLPFCDFPHNEPRRATVLYDGEFHCSLCADVLLTDQPARVFAVIETAAVLIDAMDRGDRWN